MEELLTKLPAVNQQPAPEEGKTAKEEGAQKEAGGDLTVRLNGKALTLPRRPGAGPYQFFDLLAYTDIDPRNPQGEIVQTLNGGPPPIWRNCTAGIRRKSIGVRDRNLRILEERKWIPILFVNRS